MPAVMGTKSVHTRAKVPACGKWRQITEYLPLWHFRFSVVLFIDRGIANVDSYGLGAADPAVWRPDRRTTTNMGYIRINK